ncbi:unnamed protein product [Ectocarpus sp. 12 AP-2014]
MICAALNSMAIFLRSLHHVHESPTRDTIIVMSRGARSATFYHAGGPVCLLVGNEACLFLSSFIFFPRYSSLFSMQLSSWKTGSTSVARGHDFLASNNMQISLFLYVGGVFFADLA